MLMMLLRSLQKNRECNSEQEHTLFKLNIPKLTAGKDSSRLWLSPKSWEKADIGGVFAEQGGNSGCNQQAVIISPVGLLYNIHVGRHV